jgi:hypothetical protein
VSQPVRSPIGCCNVLSEAGLQVGLHSAAGAGEVPSAFKRANNRKVQEMERGGSYGLPSDVYVRKPSQMKSLHVSDYAGSSEMSGIT